MELYYLKYRKEVSPNWLILSETKTISLEDLSVHAKWRTLKDLYDKEFEENYEWVDKAVFSIINAIVHSQRLVFGMTWDKTKNLLKNDKNWQQTISLSKDKFKDTEDSYYKYLLKRLQEGRVIEKVRDHQRKKPGIYRVVDPIIRNMITVSDEAQQLKEVIDFIDNNSEKTKRESKRESERGSNAGVDSKIDRQLESKKDTSSSIVENEKEEIDLTMTILFKTKFGYEGMISWVELKDNIPTLASYCVENIAEEYVTKNDFLKFLKTTTKDGKFSRKKNKIGKTQEEWAKSLADKFMEEVDLYRYQKHGTKQIKEPTIKKVKKEHNKQTKNNSNDLKYLFADKSMKTLQQRINQSEDEQDIIYYQGQIELIKRIIS